MFNKNIINGILCCANPIIPLCNNHYVCGCDLAIFSSIAEVEKSLTCLTSCCPKKGNTYFTGKPRCANNYATYNYFLELSNSQNS